MRDYKTEYEETRVIAEDLLANATGQRFLFVLLTYMFSHYRDNLSPTRIKLESFRITKEMTRRELKNDGQEYDENEISVMAVSLLENIENNGAPPHYLVEEMAKIVWPLISVDTEDIFGTLSPLHDPDAEGWNAPVNEFNVECVQAVIEAEDAEASLIIVIVITRIMGDGRGYRRSTLAGFIYWLVDLVIRLAREGDVWTRSGPAYEE